MYNLQQCVAGRCNVQVAAVSGDVRRCLELLRRAAEITAAEAKPAAAEALPQQSTALGQAEGPSAVQGQAQRPGRHSKGAGQRQPPAPVQQPVGAQNSTEAQPPAQSEYCSVMLQGLTELQ